MSAVDLSCLEEHLRRQREFSLRTFGPGESTARLLAHLRKELDEVEAAEVKVQRIAADLISDPDSACSQGDLDAARAARLREWIDVVILGFDGALRASFSPGEVVRALLDKQAEIEARRWPDWRSMPDGAPIEHVRGELPAGIIELPAGILAELKHVEDLEARLETCGRCRGTGGVARRRRRAGQAPTRECPTCRGTAVVERRAPKCSHAEVAARLRGCAATMRGLLDGELLMLDPEDAADHASFLESMADMLEKE